jgi:hypothetical protein
MNNPRPRPTAALLLGALLALGACNEPLTGPEATPASAVEADAGEAALLASLGADASAPRIPFADAEVFFELNATDRDLGLQVFLDAEGWERVVVADPARERIVALSAEGNLAELGITELRFESAEPAPGPVLDLFPPGTYFFAGRTVGGAVLFGRSALSHDFLPPSTFSPSDGDVVDPDDTVVAWSAPNAELVEVIIESDEVEGVFDVVVPAGTGSLDVPPQFLEAGTTYKIEVLSIAENGNKTIAESTFVTMPGAGS